MLTLNDPSNANAVLGTTTGDPVLAFRHEAAVGVFAATVSFEHALVVIEHKAGVTDAALLAGDGDPVARALAAAVRVHAGGRAGWQAVCVVTVGWALQGAEAAVPPDGRPEPLVLAGHLEGVQRLAERVEELPELTEAVHAAHQEGLERHAGGTLGPGRALQGGVAGRLSSLEVVGTAFSVHDLLLLHLDAVLFDFVAMWIDVLVFPAVHELLLVLS